MPHAFERLPDRRMDFINQPSGFRPVPDGGLNDGEFVAAEPGRHIGLAEATAQALGDALEQLIADRMAERVVDALELVDVDIEHRQLLARPYRLQRLFQPLAEQDPVRQVGQPVVMRQMRDLLVGACALGDVLDGGDPAAALQRPVDDLDRPAARRFRELARRLAERHRLDDRVAELIDVAIEGSGFLPVRDQPLHGAARLGHVRRQAEHLEIGLVANDDPRGCIIENKALAGYCSRQSRAGAARPPAADRSSRWRLSSRPATTARTDDQRQQHAFAKAPCRVAMSAAIDAASIDTAQRKQLDRSCFLAQDRQNRPAFDGRSRCSPDLPLRMRQESVQWNSDR